MWLPLRHVVRNSLEKMVRPTLDDVTLCVVFQMQRAGAQVRSFLQQPTAGVLGPVEAILALARKA